MKTGGKLLMNDYWDLGVTTFLSDISWYIIYWNFLNVNIV